MHYFALLQRTIHPENPFSDEERFELYTAFQKWRAPLKQGECLTFAMGSFTPNWMYSSEAKMTKTLNLWAFSTLGGV